jgi:hypothetical protein
VSISAEESSGAGRTYVARVNGAVVDSVVRTENSGTLRIKRVAGRTSLQFKDASRGRFVNMYSVDTSDAPATTTVQAYGTAEGFIDEYRLRPERVLFPDPGVATSLDEGFVTSDQWTFTTGPDTFVGTEEVDGNGAWVVVSNGEGHSPIAGQMSIVSKFAAAGNCAVEARIADLVTENVGGLDAYVALRVTDPDGNQFRIRASVVGGMIRLNSDASDPDIDPVEYSDIANVPLVLRIARRDGLVSMTAGATQLSIGTIGAGDLHVAIVVYNGNHEETSVRLWGHLALTNGRVVFDELDRIGEGWGTTQRYPVLDDRGRIPGDYLADYWGEGGGGGGAGEDVSYMTLLDSSPFGRCYYDAFNLEDEKVVPSGDPLPTYYTMGSYWAGESGSVLTSLNAVEGGGTHYAFFPHVDHSVAGGGMLVEYSTDGATWAECTPDETTNVLSGFTELFLRLTWRGTGDLASFGVLYEGQNNSYITDQRLREVLVAQVGYAPGTIIAVPGVGRYTIGGKDFEVYLNGSRLVKNIGYQEVTPATIRTLVAISPGDTLEFSERYGYVDKSWENRVRLDAEHDLAGRHVLRDTNNPDAWYQLVVTDGVLGVSYYSPVAGVPPEGLQAAVDLEHAQHGEHVFFDTAAPTTAYRLVVTNGSLVLTPYVYGN